VSATGRRQDTEYAGSKLFATKPDVAAERYPKKDVARHVRIASANGRD
jgi:hypothetical protein